MALLTGRRSVAARFLAVAIATVSIPTERASSQSAAAPALEAQVKAAFLYNFSKFVDWPPSVTSTKDGIFVIAVLGDTPVLAALRGLEGQDLKGRRLVVRQVQHASEAACHVLFVSASQTSAFAGDAGRLTDLPILTVGEGDEFLKAGGMIALVRIDGKIRYRIRARQAEIARLAISSKLLNLADQTGEGR